MKGLAPPDTLTGKIQRALTDEWQALHQIVWGLDYTGNVATVRACLDRLVSEGRATVSASASDLPCWREAGDARTSQRVAGTADPLGDDGNAGTPVA